MIDEVKINIEAVIIGRGIPLFTPDDFDLKVQLKGLKTLSCYQGMISGIGTQTD